MRTRSGSWLSSTRLLLAGVPLVLAIPTVAVGEDPDDMVAETEDHRDMLAETEDPDDLLAETEDHRDMLAETEDHRDMLAETEDPDTMVTGTHALDAVARPDSKPARIDTGREPAPDGDGGFQSFTPRQSAGGGDSGTASHWTAKLAEARARLDHATRDRAHWDGEYSRAITHDTVRGDARARVVSERDRATQEEANARKQLAATAEQARRAGVNVMVINSFASTD